MILTFLMGGVASIGLIIFLSYHIITYTTQPFIYDEITELPPREVAVVLGTNRYTSDGNSNGHYHRRLEAVAELIKAKKIKYVLLSGDNSTRWYNEPTRMRNDLIALGVSPKQIYQDYAGFRTLDSMIRAKEVFGLDSFIIVSGNSTMSGRSISPDNNDINAIAFNADGKLIASDYSSRIRRHWHGCWPCWRCICSVQPKMLGPDVIRRLMMHSVSLKALHRKKDL